MSETEIKAVGMIPEHIAREMATAAQKRLDEQRDTDALHAVRDATRRQTQTHVSNHERYSNAQTFAPWVIAVASVIIAASTAGGG